MKKMNRILFGLVALLATQPAMASLTQRFSSYLPSFGAAKTTRPVSYPKPTGIGQGIFSKPTGLTFGQGAQIHSRKFSTGFSDTPFSQKSDNVTAKGLPKTPFVAQKRDHHEKNGDEYQAYPQNIQHNIQMHVLPSMGSIIAAVIAFLFAYGSGYEIASEMALDAQKTILENMVDATGALTTENESVQEFGNEDVPITLSIARTLLERLFSGQRSYLSKSLMKNAILSASTGRELYEAYKEFLRWYLTSIIYKKSPYKESIIPKVKAKEGSILGDVSKKVIRTFGLGK